MEYASRGDLTKSNSLSLDIVNKSPLHSLNRLFLIARNKGKSNFQTHSPEGARLYSAGRKACV